MTDKMDVDNSKPEPISASSSIEKLDTSKLDLDALNEIMKSHCNHKAWDVLLERAKQDASIWQPLFCDVLQHLTSALEATEAKSSVISPPNLPDAKAIVNSFKEKELEEWKVGVLHGVQTNDWAGLITHRTYILDYCMVGSRLIATTAKLRKPKVRNVALGVPIELSALHFSHFILLLCSHFAHRLSWLRGWYVCFHNALIVLIRFVT
jgi:hypothetical protein